MALLKTVVGLWGKVRTSMELRKYTPYTIGEHFRKMGAQIGEGCYIVPTYLGAEPYLIKIGNHVAIASGVEFATHDGAVWVFRDEVPDLQVFGPIVIEDNCIIGFRAMIFPNVRIGRNSVVAAGSLVINDVPPNSLVMGVPARPFGSMEKYREKCLQRWAQQRPRDIMLEEGETWWNSRHYALNRKKLQSHLLTVFHDRLQSEFIREMAGNDVRLQTNKRAHPGPDHEISTHLGSSEVNPERP